MMWYKLVGIIAFIFLTTGIASADLDGYRESLRASAQANIGDFRAGLGSHFGASEAELDHVFLAVGDPADAALCFWLSRTSGRPTDLVLQKYRAHRKQGWGALAQSLGIKPGSAEFKALKAGEIGWNPPGAHGKSDLNHDPKTGKSSIDKGAKGKGKNQ